MKNVFWIAILSLSIFNAQATCELSLKKTIRFESKEQFSGPLYKFADDTVYLGRQNTHEYAFVKPDGSYKIYLPPTRLMRDPTVLKNGKLLFSSTKGELIEINSNAEIVQSVYFGAGYVFDRIIEWDQQTWFLSKTDGKIYSSKPYDNKTTQIFDLNADVTNPDDRDSFFQAPVNYQNKYLIINPYLDGRIRFLDKEGSNIFEFSDLLQNSFQDPLQLKDGRVLAAGTKYGSPEGYISIIDPNNSFQQEQILLGPNKYPSFVMARKNGGYVVGLVSLNEERTGYDQHLTFFDSAWTKTSEISTLRAGFDLTWKSLELADGHIVNGVKDTIQLISSENEVVSTFKLPNVRSGSNYQAVDGDPVLLSDETIVYLGDSTELYYFKKECSVE